MPIPPVSRRQALKTATATLALASASAFSAPEKNEVYRIKNGRIRQSVVTWCYQPLTVPELARQSVRMGVPSVELIGPEHWPMLKELGLKCAIAGSHGFTKGFAHVEEHAECLASLEKRLAECAAAGVPSVITFSGMRRGLPPEVARKNMIDGLKKIAGPAERHQVTVCLEMLNSRDSVQMKGHPDYFCDDIDLSMDIIKAVGSPRVKVLFDIYHVQIMNGDVIRRIRQYHPFIGHYHTAGNPGRNEIDDTQEINYPPIMRAILETKYEGYVAQEFIPLRDPAASLSQGVQICDV